MGFLNQNFTINGQIKVPVLTMHTTGDGFVIVQNENTYARLVKAAGNGALLNQTYVNRAGHCTFTPAERLTAFNNLISRLETGQWKNGQEAARLNGEAAALGPNFNVRLVNNQVTPTPSAFITYQPGPFPREFSTQAPTPRPLPNTGLVPGPSVFFPQTGFTVGSALLSFWQSNGGLPIFGYPLGSERQQNGQVFQWFERNRLELHPEKAYPYNVELGLLGSEALANRGVDWSTLPKVNAAPPGCRYFVETGHSLCADFLGYWQAAGLDFDGQAAVSFAESLALFGLPISEPRLETNSSGDTVMTQWFERARFEFHPDNPAQYKVLLGRLGGEMLPLSPGN